MSRLFSFFFLQIIRHTDSWTHRFLLAHAWIYVLISWKEEANVPRIDELLIPHTRDFQQFDSYFQLNRFLRLLFSEWRDPLYNYTTVGKKKNRDTWDKYKEVQHEQGNFPFLSETLGFVEFWPLTFLNLFPWKFLSSAPPDKMSRVEGKKQNKNVRN